jgi:hypothetical protein
MKKIYKIFGAAAIIGLFLLSSIASTSMAAPRQQNPVVIQEESLQIQAQPQQPAEDEAPIEWDDQQIPLQWYGETSPYEITEEILGLLNGHILVTLGWRLCYFPLQRGKLFLHVRNVIPSTSPGGDLAVTVRELIGGNPGDLVYQGTQEVGTVSGFRLKLKMFPILGTIDFSKAMYYFKANIDPDANQFISLPRIGVFVGSIIPG